jgi:hypothetical protein
VRRRVLGLEAQHLSKTVDGAVEIAGCLQGQAKVIVAGKVRRI